MKTSLLPKPLFQKWGGITISIVENIPFDARTRSAISLLKAAKHIAKSGEILSSGLTVLPLEDAISVEAFLKLFSGGGDGAQGGYLIDVFDGFQKNLDDALIELTYASHEMQNVNPQDFPLEFQASVHKLDEKIPQLLSIIEALRDYSRISSLLLGDLEPKRYLILFQNSSELRPTGGFIGTYAILDINKGKIENMFVEGIYSADGKLTVNVVPPEPFQHIATAWSTHDANWFLDFPTSAEKVIWFYEKTGGGKVDGVITLNIELVENLLRVTGPIDIPEYNLALTSENFRDEIQYEVEVAYDKELNRPKKVLSDFTPVFLERLFEVSKTKNKEMLSIITSALEEKYVMLYSRDEEVQEFFKKQGWTGGINQEPGSDYLAVVHSNIGGYKTSKYMEDEIRYDVEVTDEGSIVGNLTIRRKHNGGDTKYWWYNRKNIDYVKVYVPSGSQIISSYGGTIRKVKNPVDYDALNFLKDPDILDIETSRESSGSVEVFRESGKTVFGTWIVTSPGYTREFKISYKLPFKVEFNNNAAKYNLYLQKQPGTKFKTSVAFDVPPGIEIVWDNSNTGGGAPERSFVLDKDKVLGYIFRQTD